MTTRMDEHGKTGICLNCGVKGPVGDFCNSPGCKNNDYAFILPNKSRRKNAIGDPIVGRRIEKYLVLDMIGKGGFGTVYLAESVIISQRVALKFLSHTDSQVLIRLFKREAGILAQLNHPNIVRILDYGEYSRMGNIPYIVMEYIADARSLSKEIRNKARKGEDFSYEELTHLVFQVLNALGEAHSKQIIHRDLKPDNILLQDIVGDRIFVKLLDFGLAKSITRDSQMSLVMGTPSYMAPEQFQKGAPIGPWTDLYSLGLLVFELMTQIRLFKGETYEIKEKKLNKNNDPLADFLISTEMPEIAVSFFRQALAFEHNQRFQTVEDFRVVFQKMLDFLRDEEVTLTMGDISELLTDSDRLKLAYGSSTDIDEATEEIVVSSRGGGAHASANVKSTGLDAHSRKTLTNPIRDKGAGSGRIWLLILSGLVASGLVLGGYWMLRGRTSTPPQKQAHRAVAVHVVPARNGPQQVRKAPKKIRKKPLVSMKVVKVRPILKTRKGPSPLGEIKVYLDGELKGVTTKTSGVPILLKGKGPHEIKLEGDTIVTTTKIVYLKHLRNILFIPVRINLERL